MTPFAMTSASQFRPGPPVDLKSKQWAADYNEIKELGEKNSTKRTARQTEDARFWLTTGPLSTHSMERQIVIGKNMSVPDSARFMAMVSVAEADAIQVPPDRGHVRLAALVDGGDSRDHRLGQKFFDLPARAIANATGATWVGKGPTQPGGHHQVAP